MHERFLELATGANGLELIHENKELLGTDFVQRYVASANASRWQIDMVLHMLKEPTFEGFIFWLHEAIESLSFLDRFSVEQVVSGEANLKEYEIAHNYAMEVEFLAFKKIAINLGINNVAHTSIALVNPIAERCVRFNSREYQQACLNMLLRSGRKLFMYIRAEEVNIEGIVNALELFTNPIIGHTYNCRSQLFRSAIGLLGKDGRLCEKQAAQVERYF